MSVSPPVTSDGSWSKQNFLLLGSGWVTYLWFRFGFGKFPLKIPNYPIFFPSGQKNCFGSGQKVRGSEMGQPLIYCWSTVCSGRVRSGPIFTCYWCFYFHHSFFTSQQSSSFFDNFHSCRFINATLKNEMLLENVRIGLVGPRIIYLADGQLAGGWKWNTWNISNHLYQNQWSMPCWIKLLWITFFKCILKNWRQCHLNLYTQPINTCWALSPKTLLSIQTDHY